MKKKNIILSMLIMMFLGVVPAMCQDEFGLEDFERRFPLTVEQQQQETDVIVKTFNEFYAKKAELGKPEDVTKSDDSTRYSWAGLTIEEPNTTAGAWENITILEKFFNDEGDSAKPEDQYSFMGLHYGSSYEDFESFKVNIPSTWKVETNRYDASAGRGYFTCEYSKYLFIIVFDRKTVKSISCRVKY